ncbi:MAG: hypothetical protein GY789_05610 [Hyphomicrobiales bacterium]|nr:hypothetical protein [Hyphomicrobiales bacterium]MCP5001947.1 hypothetical protein [Hyphomicrobiales bacterium]
MAFAYRDAARSRLDASWQNFLCFGSQSTVANPLRPYSNGFAGGKAITINLSIAMASI